jgi:quinol monooxygenase YgiN
LIIAIVKASIKENKHTALREIANTLQFEYAPHEEGCEQYESYIDGDTFITIERWQDQASLDIHLQASHVEKYVPLLRECVVDGCFDVQFINTNDVSFTRI